MHIQYLSLSGKNNFKSHHFIKMGYFNSKNVEGI